MGRLLGTLFYAVAIITVAIGVIAALSASSSVSGMVLVWAVAGAVPSAFFGIVCFALSDIAEAVKKSADYAGRAEERAVKVTSTADNGIRMSDATPLPASTGKPEQRFRGKVAG